MNRLPAWLLGALLVSHAALAQLALPGATSGNSAPENSEPGKPAHRTHSRHSSAAPIKAAGPESVIGKTLRLNGRNGELQLQRGEDGALDIVKFSLLGEVISRPAQACRIDIVAEKPIAAVSKGAPDGLPRYSADIPACPLSFDILDGAVLAPAQANACVFSAADCQASPSGLWGPPAGDLDLKTIEKTRAAADRAIQDSLRDLESRDKDAAASLSREQSDFAAERDDLCHDYANETRLGFCAAELARSRAALLAKRTADAGPAHEHREHKRRRAKAE